MTLRSSGVMLGASLLAFVYLLLPPRLLPDVVSFPESVSGSQIAAVRWLVGMVLGASRGSTPKSNRLFQEGHRVFWRVPHPRRVPIVGRCAQSRACEFG